MINVVDLFSGAGGMTLGFKYIIKNNTFKKSDVFDILFANEFDKDAASTFRNNFPEINMVEKDIKNLTGEEINKYLDGKKVDLIIGGPPCQSFSTVGKRVYDDKAKMYQQYLRLLKIIRPKMFLFENVRGILSMKETFYKTDSEGNILYDEIVSKTGRKSKKPQIDYYGDKILDKIKKEFKNIDKDFGYKIKYQVLKASDFGVPQNRERVFIVGVRNDINKEWTFPIPLNKDTLSIKEAIDDLPELKSGQSINKYSKEPVNYYQKLMRKKSNVLTQHVAANYGEKIRTVIKNVPQGEGKNYFNKLVEEGKIDKKYYLTSGYANTYSRLIETEPSTTITNNLTTPSALRCIHYRDDRALSPREGARIQSFPDWFDFSGNMGKVAMQIGNAVPPLLAMAIAEQIRLFMEEKSE
ncbi:MAG: DNA cytosine methyltransferase [Clostridia bacterium]|nr:DNA cytosine methyltransferase [Clostridia bacterium]